MKRYLGVHINPTALRSAVMMGDKPVLVPTRDGGLTYSTAEVFTLSENGWTCHAQRLSQLLTWVREDVERFVGRADWEIVLTIPAAFGYAVENQYLRPAAQAAGMPVAYLLRESAAVALNYFWNGMGRGEDAFRAVVAMASSKTVGVSVLESSDGIVEELAVTGRRGSVSPEHLQRQMEEAVRVAEEESPVNTASGAGIRAWLLNNEAVRKPEFREVMSRVKQAGQKVYGYPDETAALGAALHGAKLSGDPRVQEPLMLTAVSHEYYVLLADQRRVTLISRGTCCPTRRSIVLTTAKDGQTNALIRVAEAESQLSKAEIVLQWEKTGLTPRKAGETRIEVTMEVLTNGVVQCTAKELTPEQSSGAVCQGALPPAESAQSTAGTGSVVSREKEESRTGSQKEKEPVASKREEMVSLAEFENFRSRMTREKDAMYDQGVCKALQKFLPIVDSFERGLAMLSPEQRATEAAAGMERIYRQMQKAMEELGVTPIEAVGQPFDLNRHNAVMQADIPGISENIVVEELEKGYLYHDTVLRYSVVKVNK